MERWTSVFGWLLSIATVLGNGFVVILIVKRRRLHSSSNWLVFSLAVADLGVGIVAFPLTHLCDLLSICNMRVYTGFYWFILHSSVTNLCSLTWDRFTAIVHPLKYHTSMTARRTLVVITLAWLIPFLIALYLVSGMYITNSPTALKIIRLTGVSGFDILGCILLLHAIVRILIVKAKHQASVKSERRQLQHNQSLNISSLPQRRKHTNTANFIIALVLFFLGSYVITSILIFCRAFSCVNRPTEVSFVTLLLLTGNSTVNPLVYAFLKKDIKREIKIVVCRLELRNNNDERS
ncbi:trace amine-associated receptor 7d-like [Montipora foliosa]|uniref:trace amine-associated receptor 7d-like n=1 Tax=Montipora foliosa TaxID=591990 RepID=UPI0035F1B49D